MHETGMYDEATADELFELDVQVVTDVVEGHEATACKTSDNCPPTCASACAGSR